MTPPLRPTVDELRAVCQPPELLARRSEEHWTGRYMRRVSIHVTRLVIRTPLSANAVTGIMVLVGLMAALLIAVGGLAGVIAGALAVQLYLCLDCVDGEVARWRGTTGIKGVYLDRLGHYLVEAAIVAAIGVRAAGSPVEASWVILGLVGAIFVMIEKVETDLVLVARMRAGSGVPADADATMRHGGLATARRVAERFPVHLATHAAEASLLALTAAVVDTARGDLAATRILLVVLVAVSGAMTVLHLVAVLASGRLEPPSPPAADEG